MRMLASLLIFSWLMSSCTTYKQLQYLQGEFTDSLKYASFKVPEQRAQKGDQLAITVFSANAAASMPFNTGTVSTGVGMQQPLLGSGNTYEVDKDGNIFFPVIGLVHVEGLTREGITALLDSKLKGILLNEPYYVIRFQNLRFTVFGEVQSPGVYPITKNNLNIFEALTTAGDLTQYGKRTNILVIRENNGKREFGRIDITKPDAFNSPYYYLQQNDMVMVDMLKQKVVGSDQAILRNVTVIVSLMTALAFFTNIFK